MYIPPMQYWIVSPRMPPDSALVRILVLRLGLVLASSALLMFMIRVVIVSEGLLSFNDSLMPAVGILCAFNFLIFFFRNKFSFFNSLEITLGIALFVLGPYADDLSMPLFGIAALAAFRPYSEGPEPNGWHPLYSAMQLKGRRDK